MSFSVFRPILPRSPVEPLSSSPIVPIECPSSHTTNQKEDIYRPIRGIPGARSRVRPALPESYLQLDGSSGPWKKRIDPETTDCDTAMDDVFIQRLSEASLNSATISHGSSSMSSSVDSSLILTPTSTDPTHRISTCFGPPLPAAEERSVLSQSGKRSPGDFANEDESMFSTPKKQKSEGGLKPWKTQTTDRSPNAFATIGYRRAKTLTEGSPSRSASTRRIAAAFRRPASGDPECYLLSYDGTKRICPRFVGQGIVNYQGCSKDS